MIDAVKGEAKPLTSGEDWNDADPQWSPDGTPARICLRPHRQGVRRRSQQRCLGDSGGGAALSRRSPTTHSTTPSRAGPRTAGRSHSRAKLAGVNCRRSTWHRPRVAHRSWLSTAWISSRPRWRGRLRVNSAFLHRSERAGPYLSGGPCNPPDFTCDLRVNAPSAHSKPISKPGAWSISRTTSGASTICISPISTAPTNAGSPTSTPNSGPSWTLRPSNASPIRAATAGRSTVSWSNP